MTKATSFVSAAVRQPGHLPARYLRLLREAGPDQGQGDWRRKPGSVPAPGEHAFNTGGGHEGWVQAVAGELSDVLGWKVDIKSGSVQGRC